MARSFRSGILRRPSSTEAGPRGGLIQFFGEVVGELKKVTWSTRKELMEATKVVMVSSFLLGFFPYSINFL